MDRIQFHNRRYVVVDMYVCDESSPEAQLKCMYVFVWYVTLLVRHFAKPCPRMKALSVHVGCGNFAQLSQDVEVIKQRKSRKIDGKLCGVGAIAAINRLTSDFNIQSGKVLGTK
ncbi:MAG: hypothetical protein GY820_28470 [Gammaproteobacteria bacterium]|nr:hypothetical protein [Gammaproteobacteria bacterium]